MKIMKKILLFVVSLIFTLAFLSFAPIGVELLAFILAEVLLDLGVRLDGV
ncbi:MAG: hypothetical protein NTW85_15865 [Methylococcales bacterium]|nr:hypothetical protein [Methylococcales bacterium]